MAPERAVAAWFGPKGSASVVYALLVLHSGIPAGDQIFHLVTVVVALSILLHSSTDVPIAHWPTGRRARGALGVIRRPLTRGFILACQSL
ncbi:hypothetical protein CcI49_28190 [Frankia sp. CcI49]|nr:hypothetical protein [Frankia sp. CcI49]ONH55413.1 hypothetical protein CcI49_28190 [Frankia sp. CcI49]